MKKLLLIILPVLIGVILAIIFFWCWVTTNPELTAGFLTSLILLLASIAALLNLRQMRHDRVASIAAKIRETYDSGEILEARILVLSIINEQEKQGIKSKEEKGESFRDTVKQYKKNNPKEFIKLISIPSMFDTVGWLVREHCCEARAIDAQLDWKAIYELWESYIMDAQDKQTGESLDDSPTAMYGNFIWLVNTLVNKID